jgi:5-methylcytosine-specific restriction endonuclease McrA
MSKYRQENPELVREYQRWYRQEHKEDKRKYMYKYRQDHKDDNREYKRLHNLSRKQKMRELECDLTKDDIAFIFLIQNGKCPSCGKLLENYHIDHIIPVSKGGGLTRTNVQLLCPYCNHSKHDKTIDYLGNYLTGRFATTT